MLDFEDLKADPFVPPQIGSAGVGNVDLSFGPSGELFKTTCESGESAAKFERNGNIISLPQPKGSWLRFPLLRPLSDGRWLVVDTRTDGQQANAHVYEPKDIIGGSFFVGDAIEWAFVDSLDRIWIGYFDEGFGKPLSANGLSCFSTDGALLFAFADHSQRFVVDVYAMTIDKNDCAWICPYTEFFVARVCNREVEFVLEAAPTRGAKALLVGESHLGFIGGYKRDAARSRRGMAQR